MSQPSNRRARTFGRHRQTVVGIRRHAVGALVDRSQRLALQAAPYSLRTHLQALLTQPANDARTPIAAFARRVHRRHLRIQPRIGLRPGARRAPPPLQVARARHQQQAAHPADRVVVAMLLDPGVPHRDSFAKYAAAFFTFRSRWFERTRSAPALGSGRPERIAGFPASRRVASAPGSRL